MSNELPIIWEIEPHTKAKHEILRKYLGAWLPIMSTTNGRIIFVDGFAGPGMYKGGEEGSPLIAVKAALEHQHLNRLKASIEYVFIEENPQILAFLTNLLHENFKNLPPNITIRKPLKGTFQDVLPSILESVPMFVFTDPFGFSDTPMDLIGRVLRIEKSELLITFMKSWIARFLDHPKQPENFDELFGTQAWRKGIDLPMDRRLEFLTALYRDQLKYSAGAKYVRHFSMEDKHGLPIYDLFFTTNSKKGLQKMKEAMWKVDKTGNYRYSDATNPDQIVLFDEPDYSMLGEDLMKKFAGSLVEIQEMEDFVLINTAFCTFKEKVLVPMEMAGKLEVFRSAGKRKGTYPKGTKLRFF